MRAQCGSAFHAVTATDVPRPPLGRGGNLFAINQTSIEVAGFHELVVCPSVHGAHILGYKNNCLYYKVKAGVTLHHEFARFSLHEVNKRGVSVPTAIGHIEKVRTVLSSKWGKYTCLQAWHAAVFRPETKPVGSSAPNLKKTVKAPEARAVNMLIKASGKLDVSRGREGERWDTQFALSDPDYRVQVEGQGHHASTTMTCIRIHHRDTLVCTGRMQGFSFLDRPHFLRPFLGIQLKADRKNSIAAINDSSLDFHDYQDLLPVLLCLAWGEEAVLPPEDMRADFNHRMRSKDDTGVVSTASCWDPMLTVASSNFRADDGEGEHEADVPGSLHWDIVPPLAPAPCISTHLQNKPLRIQEAQKLSASGSISLMGV